MIFISSLVTILAFAFMQTAEASDFKDLGKWLVVGFVFAVVAGVGFTLLRQCLRDKRPATSDVISITGHRDK